MGVWVEAFEQITYSHTGKYSVVIKTLDGGTTLLSYSNNNIDMWRTGTTFCRPKWGIYRSLNSSSFLRDEQVRFDHFCIAKGSDVCPSDVTDRRHSDARAKRGYLCSRRVDLRSELRHHHGAGGQVQSTGGSQQAHLPEVRREQPDQRQ